MCQEFSKFPHRFPQISVYFQCGSFYLFLVLFHVLGKRGAAYLKCFKIAYAPDLIVAPVVESPLNRAKVEAYINVFLKESSAVVSITVPSLIYFVNVN